MKTKRKASSNEPEAIIDYHGQSLAFYKDGTILNGNKRLYITELKDADINKLTKKERDYILAFKFWTQFR